MSQTKSKPHPKDINRRPGTVRFTDGDWIVADHVDAHEGYVFVIDGERLLYEPWHRIREVELDV